MTWLDGVRHRRQAARERRRSWLGRIGIRWLLLGVGFVGLALPALAMLALDAFDLYLVQETERRLLGQGAVIGQAFRLAWVEESRAPLGNPRPPNRRNERYAPYVETVETLDALSPPLPNLFPNADPADPAATRAGQRLQPVLRDSMIFHLTGVRVLDRRGTVVASTQPKLGFSLAQLGEVRRALAGEYSAVLRERVSDEPAPPLGSLSRRGKFRVFSVQPIWNGPDVIGAVFQSRTAETSTEWLWKQRRGLLFFTGALMIAALLLSFGFARTIERPLRSMSLAAKAIADGQEPAQGLLANGGPREVQLLARSLDTMAQQIQLRNRYIADFVATVGHELKSPLTSISGASELLSEEWNEIPEAQRQRFLANIRAAADRTTKLVQRLLTLARAENPEAIAAPGCVDLEQLRTGLLDRYPDQLSVTIQGEIRTARVRRDDLDCVLSNLLDNALRYRRSARVSVSLRVLPSSQLELEVANDGPPISPSNQARLFQRFFTTERDSGGTGLGLSIIKAVAEAHGGSVAVVSDDQSTRFTVVL